MKLIIPVVKPRAKWLNDILVSKKSIRHSDSRVLSKQQQKIIDKKNCYNF